MTYKLTPEQVAQIAARVDECEHIEGLGPCNDIDEATEQAFGRMAYEHQRGLLKDAAARIVELKKASTFWMRLFFASFAFNAALIGAIVCSVLWGR